MSDYLKDWLRGAKKQRRFEVAEKAGTSVAHLQQVAGGYRRVSPELAERLEIASDGELTVGGLRPDILALAQRMLSRSAIR